MEKEKDPQKSIFIREASTNQDGKAPAHGNARLKKMLIYALMAVACAASLYLIFKPKDEQKADEIQSGTVPQATDKGLEGDKVKAYEQELLEKKQQEKRNALLTLSDYLQDSASEKTPTDAAQKDRENPALEGTKSYAEIQNTLGNFYERDREKDALRKEIKELRERINTEPVQNSTQDPLYMMEKSYQMAAKYLPQVLPKNPSPDAPKPAPERYVEPVYNAQKPLVTSLSRNKEQSDSAFVRAVLNADPARLFGGQSSRIPPQKTIMKNSIKACIHRTQTLTEGSSVALRLLEGARIAGMQIPPGTLLTAMAKIQDGRLALQVTSVEFKGNIVPVDISAYDLDGQPGLNLPYAPDVNAIKEVTSAMSTSAGTNIALSSSTGQQLMSDLTKGVVQGASGYLSKKIGNPKVTVKAGHLLFLLPKK